MVDGSMIKTLIMAIIALLILANVTSSTIPSTVTTLSNTSAIPGYSTWSTGVQSQWTSLASIVILVVIILFFLLLVAVADRF